MYCEWDESQVRGKREAAKPGQNAWRNMAGLAAAPGETSESAGGRKKPPMQPR